MIRNILIITFHYGEDSRDYLARCLQKAQEEGIRDIVVLGGAEWSREESHEQAQTEIKKLLRMINGNAGFIFQPLGGKLKTALSTLLIQMKMAGVTVNKIVICAQRSQLDRYQREALAIKDLGLIKLSTHGYHPPDAMEKKTKFQNTPKPGWLKKFFGG